MPFEGILDGRQKVFLPADPGIVWVIAIGLKAGYLFSGRPVFVAAAYYGLGAWVWANWPPVSVQGSYSRSCYCSAGNQQVWRRFARLVPG